MSVASLNNSNNQQAEVNTLTSEHLVKSPPLTHISEPKDSRKKLFILVAVLLVLVVGALLVLTQKKSTVSTETYVLAGTTKGRGMSFDRYDIFSTPLTVKGLPTKVSFAQSQKNDKDKTSAEVARLSAIIRDMSTTASATTTGGPTPEYATTLRTNLVKNPSTPEYQLATKVIKGIAKSSFGGEIIVTLGPAKPYTNETIKKDAWQFSVSTVGNSFDNVQPQKGTMVVAIGKKSYYHFIVTATDTYRAKNTNSLNKILSSLKIDQ
jgi:hypothetical protein